MFLLFYLRRQELTVFVSLQRLAYRQQKAEAKLGPFSHAAAKATALFKNRIEIQPFPVEYPAQFLECFNLYLAHPFPGQTDFFPDVLKG